MIDKKLIPIVVAVLKLLEATHRATSRKADKYRKGGSKRVQEEIYDEIDRVMSIMSEKEKDTFKKVFLSMLLMTAGNVASVRNPDSYDPSTAKSIAKMFNSDSHRMWTAISDIPAKNYVPTKQDYITAKKLLPMVSSISNDVDKMLALLKDREFILYPDKFVGDEDIKIADTLYRGLNSMSRQTLMLLFLVPGASWDITRAVSTSESYDTAMDFANDKKGWRILFYIDNVDKRGFHAGELSVYGEHEYILSGILTTTRASLRTTAHDENGNRFELRVTQAKGELTIKFEFDEGDRIYTGSAADKIFLSIMQEETIDAEDFGLRYFRVDGKRYTFNKNRSTVVVQAKVKTN